MQIQPMEASNHTQQITPNVQYWRLNVTNSGNLVLELSQLDPPRFLHGLIPTIWHPERPLLIG